VKERLTKESLQEGLPTRSYGHRLFYFDEIDSTNLCARTLAETGSAEGTVVWAEHQTAGRGRHGRTWTAEAGANITFSIILCGVSPDQRVWVPYYVSEGVAGGLEKALDLKVEAKWPNDLLIDGKKVCGILLEGTDNAENGCFVAGIGINANQSTFPDTLRASASSLLLQSGGPVDRVKVFHSVLENLEALFADVRSTGGRNILDAWKGRCSTLGKQISVRTGVETIEGTAIGLSKDGGLVLDTSSGPRTVYAGDVTLATSHPTQVS